MAQLYMYCYRRYFVTNMSTISDGLLYGVVKVGLISCDRLLMISYDRSDEYDEMTDCSGYDVRRINSSCSIVS